MDQYGRCNGQKNKNQTVSPSVGILEKSENNSRIPDGNDMEKMGDDRQAFTFEKVSLYKVFRQLVEKENQKKEEKI